MSRALCLLLCFSSLAFAQINRNSEAGSSPSSAVQVFYVIGDTTLTTYNIDPQTLESRVVGATTLPQSEYPDLVTSPDGKFLYYIGYVSGNDQKLYVYDTDAMGLPGSTPVQTTGAAQFAGLLVNPSGTFLYSVVVGPPGQQGTTPFAIVRNAIDPATGKLSGPVVEATYQLDTQSSGNDCSLSILGFDPAGTIMYDGIFCGGPHASGSSTYNQRAVDLQTGALGPDQQIYYFSYYAGSGYANVQIEHNRMFAFVTFDNQGPNADLVDVYQLPNSSPTINCTASMWAVCGDFSSFPLAHPSGEYVFLDDSNDATDIGQVNLETQQIVELNTLPYAVQLFSPDGAIAYGTASTGPYEIYISGFNPETAEVKAGGTISLTPADDYWVAAQRY
jgi:hypothetical protein